MSHLTRARFQALTLTVAAAGVLAAGVASPAHAATLLTCAGAQSVTYSPGLTNAPQPVALHVENTFQPCLNLTHPLELRTGTASTNLPAVSRTCSSVLEARPGTRVIHWSTGTTSTFTFIAEATSLAGGAVQVVQQGSITAGEFQGATAIGVVVLASTEFANCATTGVTSQGGAMTLTLLQ